MSLKLFDDNITEWGGGGGGLLFTNNFKCSFKIIYSKNVLSYMIGCTFLPILSCTAHHFCFSKDSVELTYYFYFSLKEITTK